MNCKQGDLAVIVNTIPMFSRFIGRLVTVVELNNFRPDYFGLQWDTDLKENGSTVVVADRHLRPIRDNPGQDETLTWRDVPTKETA